MGLDRLQGKTMTEVSVELHVTKAAISKAAVKASQVLNLPRSRYMKSQEASQSYRERAIQVHKRKHNEPNQ
jgi:hypothetical protein